MMNPPFHYQIRFNLLAYIPPDDIRQQVYKKEYTDPNPVVARNNAFEAFGEYISYLMDHNRIREGRISARMIPHGN